MAYNNKYLALCKTSFWNRSIWAYIQERDLGAGESQNVDMPYEQPLILKTEAPDETLESPIRGSVLTLKMESDTDRQFYSLMTSDGKRFKLAFYWKSGYIWYGWLLPDTYSEPHKPIEYSIAVKASDTLGALKDMKWIDTEGDNFEGKKEILQTIIDILARLGLNLNIFESCYIYESHMDSTDDDSPLEQTYFNAEQMYDDGEAKSCYEVLEQLLRRFHLTLRQSNSYFQIIQINAQNAEYVRRRYDYQGNFVNSSNYDPIIEITESSEPDETLCAWVDEWANDIVLPAWKELVLIQNYGLDDNIMNENFRYAGPGYVHFPHIGDIYPGYSDGLLFLPTRYPLLDDTKKIRSYLGEITSGPQILNIKYTIQAINYVMGKIYLYINTITGHKYYLDHEGYWNIDNKKPIWWSELSEETRYGIEIKSFPICATGSLYIDYVTINSNPRVPELGGTINIDTTLRFVVNINDSYVKLEPVNESFPEELELTTTIDENNNISETYETLIGDLPEYNNKDIIYMGGLYYKDDDGYIATSEWYKKGESETGSLNEVISDQICRNHITPKIKREGNILGEFNISNIIQENGIQFMIINDEINYADDTHKVVLVQIGGGLEGGYLKLKSGGYLRLKSGGRIKLKGRQ